MTIAYITAGLVGTLGLLFCWAGLLNFSQSLHTSWKSITSHSVGSLLGIMLIVLSLHVAGLL